ncbi:glycosyltransferase family 4 protein [Tabrizicola sp.]|uniref:glycosyltransferase family 4 protein n=1 Tax=Tabrizicola sp. TaxID=2005166 RepID=UPI003F2A8815
MGHFGDTAPPGLADCAAELADCRYLLVMPVPWYQAADGSIWLDDLWYRDLLRHLDYLRDLTVLAPRLPLASQAGMVRVDMPAGLRFLDLPWGRSVRQGLLKAPSTQAAAVRAVRQADIVHSGVAGWPFAPGFFVNPVAVKLRRPLIIVVESAFWRLAGVGPHGLAARMRARVTEGFARWSVRRATLSIFTHEGYRKSLVRGADVPSMVTPASWIDAGDVLDEATASETWERKGAKVRVLLAARLTAGKGVAVLLEALAMAGDLSLAVDVIGDGPLRGAVAEAAARLGPERLRLLDPVPYGPPFLTLLRGYHAALVPSITDEQPRVLYDAAAQAVPVLASDTEGHREQVDQGVTGLRFAPGDAAALLAALRQAAADPAGLRRMGMTARSRALGQTHQAMHLVRARKLASIWSERRKAKGV